MRLLSHACVLLSLCVCVLSCVCPVMCVTLGVTGGLELAEGQPREHSWLPNEEGFATTDMESNQLHLPALLNGW